MQGNSALMSGCVQKALSCIEARSTSPDNPQLRHDLVHVHHSATVTRHPGHWKMLELVSWNYWWPGLSRYIAKFIAGCNMCNWMKTFPTQKVGKLIPNKVPD